MSSRTETVQVALGRLVRTDGFLTAPPQSELALALKKLRELAMEDWTYLRVVAEEEPRHSSAHCPAASGCVSSSRLSSSDLEGAKLTNETIQAMRDAHAAKKQESSPILTSVHTLTDTESEDEDCPEEEQEVLGARFSNLLDDAY